jgi:hypothetical protein
MTGFGEADTCARCGRLVGIDDPDFTDGESIDSAFVCDRCVTGAERQQVDEDDMALGDALAAAGLGEDADPEAMSEDEYEMREGLAALFLDHEGGAP